MVITAGNFVLLAIPCCARMDVHRPAKKMGNLIYVFAPTYYTHASCMRSESACWQREAARGLLGVSILLMLQPVLAGRS
jgi:hypothetical protein